ncbi:MAG: hypothetical protein NTV21_06140 [Planctomycetota bacterium]|nr:hypothetical protein [Planctomycetota bacterium]
MAQANGSSTATRVAMGATVALLIVALGVRAIPGQRPLAPQDRPKEERELREPMQLLGRSASLRVAELDALVSDSRRDTWLTTRRRVFELQGCPKLGDWLDGPEGQAFERTLGELRRGSREEALAALTLTTELARRTEWTQGILRKNPAAERLSRLVADWLRAWSDRAATDSLLSEPAIAATALYARATQVAGKRVIGRDESLDAAATAFLAQQLRDAQGQATALARTIRAAHPAALTGLDERDNPLAGLDALAERLFPGLDGECK